MGVCESILVGLLCALVGVILGGLLSWWLQGRYATDLLARLKDAVQDRQHVSLGEQFLLTRLLAGRMTANSYVPDVIFGLAPGGAMVAEWLSRRFVGTYDKPIRMRTIWVRTTRDPGNPIVKEAHVEDSMEGIRAEFKPNAKALLVTDICRGGATFEAAYKFLKGHFLHVETATLLQHDNAKVEPHYRVDVTNKDVRFDWKEAQATD